MNKNTKEQFKQAQNGNKKVREQLVIDNLGLVKWQAGKFVKYKNDVDFETAYQEGCVGLLKAIDEFNPDLGFTFSTYATNKIHGEMSRYRRDKNEKRPGKIPRRMHEVYNKFKDAENELHQKLGKEPNMTEIAKFTDVNIRELEKVVSIMEKSTYLENVVHKESNNDITLGDMIEDTDSTPEEIITDKLFLKQALSTLTPRQKEVIKMYYYEEKKQEEIASMLNVSQVQVHRIISSALKNMNRLVK